ncbi:MAG: alpha/beta hydrolase [Phycisphaerae bacterium]
MIEPQLDTFVLSDGYRAAVRWWRPPDPRGAVLYLHGIQSHGGWYERSGAHLAERGMTVLMPDRRGSGKNREQRGHVESVERCVQDGIDALNAVSADSGFDSVHVVGVSWGGKLAVALAEAAPGRVRSLTLVAPGLFPRVDLSSSEKFRVAMSMINARSRMFDIPLNEPRLFTANPERIRYVEHDAHKLLQVSATFLLATRRLDRRVQRLGRSSWRGGVHMFLAGRDRIIDNERTRGWLRDLPSLDRQISEYPEAEHTLEFEADPRPFFGALTDWIVERAGKPAVGLPNRQDTG